MADFEDPFADPTPRVSDFASADSFRGRLILIEPVKVERNVPKQANVPNGPTGDRVTATVTVVDGLGPVQIYSQRIPTGKYLEGPEHVGVWFNQDQLANGLQTLKKDALLKMVLCRIDTLKPGTPAGQGNPWIMNAASPEDKQMARDFLAGRRLAQAAAPTPASNPFGGSPKAPF
jgi:hypothetical protein